MDVINATPGSINRGVDDRSKGQVLATEEEYPCHLPLFFVRAKKGPTKRIIVTSEKAMLAYGDEMFDMNDKWFNHQTLFMQAVLAQGNTCMSLRTISEDAGPKANATVYLDYIKCDIPNYLRNSDGTLIADSATMGYKVDPSKPTIEGYKIKYIKEYDVAVEVNGVMVSPDDTMLGSKTAKDGTMEVTDVNGVVRKSIMVPLFEARAKYKGSGYNDNGFGISSFYSGDADSKVLSKTKAMQYGLYLVNREDVNTSPVAVRTLAGETSQLITLKEKATDPVTDARIDFEYAVKNAWFNETDSSKKISYEEYEGIHFYRNNLEKVLKLVMDTEKQYITDSSVVWYDGVEASTSSWFDYTTTDANELDNEIYLINPFICKSVNNVPYFTLVKADDTPSLVGNQTEVSFSSSTPIFLSNGSDGTVNDEYFEKAVRTELKRYLNRDDAEVMDTAINVDSIIYDSGFEVDTKKELSNYITVRKDTIVALSTHEANLGEQYHSLSKSRSIGMVLKTRLELAPESTYFGTSVARAIICLGGGNIKGSLYTNTVPLTYELAVKTAAMLGASNGLWKTDMMFDTLPKSRLEYIVNYRPDNIPDSYKTTLWNDSLVYAQPNDRSSHHVPAWQSIYGDDTSVLNNYFAVLCIPTLSKVSDRAARYFSGSTKLSKGEFIDAVKAYYVRNLKDVFGTVFKIVPEVYIDEADEARGYSWHAKCKLYGEVIKTKQVYNTEFYRASDLTSTNN